MIEFIVTSSIILLIMAIVNKIDIQKSNSKKRTSYKQKVEKGKNYEKFIGKKFEEKGYIVKFNGIEKGKKDSSIDLIAIKGNQLILTQCKNWKEGSKYKINHEKIKAFIGDTYTFLTKNPQYQNYNIKRLYCVANDVLDKSAKKYIEQNKNVIEYRGLYIQIKIIQ